MADSLTPDELARRLREVFAQIGILYRHVYRRIEQEALPQGLSVGVRAVCELLDVSGPATVPQMGRTLALSRQFVQRMVNDAHAAQLVETRDNPRHQRSPLIALTPEGRAVIAATIAREHAVLRDVGGDLTAADIDNCLRVLHHLGRPFVEGDLDE
ncbi:MarR family winged helix-turn-helix transcriptional regulator [Nocardia sp. NPDC049526]|uniref:MarR family winged helix-turn-helix transcriptional regulator n=1 Tax=Nocardia sp. NPDC049526 TaxID=3364316 RepID=UPI0037989DC3